MKAHSASLHHVEQKTAVPANAMKQTRTQRNKAREFLPTLFDRLCDDAPSDLSEPDTVYTASRSRMREIILRDLAQLLNTTESLRKEDAQSFPEVASSSVNYGVAPMAGGYLSEKKWVDIESMIRTAIERFEPRLMKETLVVRPIQKAETEGHYNVLLFEISGHIRMTHYPIEFTVQSSVDLENSRIELRPR